MLDILEVHTEKLDLILGAATQDPGPSPVADVLAAILSSLREQESLLQDLPRNPGGRFSRRIAARPRRRNPEWKIRRRTAFFRTGSPEIASSADLPQRHGRGTDRGGGDGRTPPGTDAVRGNGDDGGILSSWGEAQRPSWEPPPSRARTCPSPVAGTLGLDMNRAATHEEVVNLLQGRRADGAEIAGKPRYKVAAGQGPHHLRGLHVQRAKERVRGDGLGTHRRRAAHDCRRPQGRLDSRDGSSGNHHRARAQGQRGIERPDQGRSWLGELRASTRRGPRSRFRTPRRMAPEPP